MMIWWLPPENPDLKIRYQKNCVPGYTSLTNYKKTDWYIPPPKKLRHSRTSFDFWEPWFSCGQKRHVNRDRKNPSRWRPVFEYCSVVGQDGKFYVNQNMDKCLLRNDEWANEVSGLRAAEASYPRDCSRRFFGGKLLSGQALPETSISATDKGETWPLNIWLMPHRRTSCEYGILLNCSMNAKLMGELNWTIQLVRSLSCKFGEELILLWGIYGVEWAP